VPKPRGKRAQGEKAKRDHVPGEERERGGQKRVGRKGEFVMFLP